MSAIAYLTRPADGEVSSGDAVVVRDETAVTLVAVIDVLGHGPAAAEVAALAVRFLSVTPITRAIALMQGLHDSLRGTRGAAAAICVMRGGSLDACSVGNVETRILGSRVPILQTPGIVGARVANLRESTGQLVRGDRLVCWSDGISSRVALDAMRHLAPRDACARIMTDHRRSHDDASVLVADADPNPKETPA